VYRADPLVGNICVYADQTKTRPVAIIVPIEPALKAFAEENGIKKEHEELIHDDKLNSLVLKQLQTTGRNGGLKGIEVIEGVVLAEEEWTPQNVSAILWSRVCLTD
jgi:long-chain acyl-CoA synthetase